MRLIDPDAPPDSGRLPKLGVLLVLFAGFILFVGEIGLGFGGGAGVLYLCFIVLFLASGIGLIARAQWARWSAGGVFLLIGLASLWQSGSLLSEQLPNMVWTLESVLWLANAVLTSALFCWLSYRAILTLIDPERPPSLWTPRLVGLVVAVASLAHLAVALTLGGKVDGIGMFMSLSSDGIRLLGFWGWPLYHVAGVLVGLGLLVGNARVSNAASAGLVVLVGVLAPSAALALLDFASAMPVFGIATMLLFMGLPLILVYLCWWLLRELGGGWPTLRTNTFRVGLALVIGCMAVAAVASGS